MLYRFVLLIIFFLSAIQLNAQSKKKEKQYDFYGRVFLENAKGENITVRLYDDNEVISEYNTDKNGKFAVGAPKLKHYTLEFEKAGFVTKRMIINTRKVLTSKNRVEDFDFNVYLIEELENVNYSILDFPIALIEYKKSIKGFDYNKKYTRQMHKIQNEVIANGDSFVFSD
ncbi:MAG: hypothetical protein JKY48_10920 [Flavobacteriales bacterium]|nr:hypothetical protein [Flavobacteriales bacterium]